MNIVTLVNRNIRRRRLNGSRLQRDARRKPTHRVIALDRQLGRH